MTCAIFQVETSVALASYVIVVACNLHKVLVIRFIGKNHELAAQGVVTDELANQFRRRLALLCVLIDEPNVLVLDEPGNDLDTDMLAELESLLDTWPGTLLLVTHDRYLAERVADNQYAIIDGRLRHMPGGVDEYLRVLDERAQAPAAPTVQEKPASKPKSSNAERRDNKRRLDAIERKLEKVRDEPVRLEAELHTLDPTDFEALLAKQAEIADARKLVDELESEWLVLIDLV